MFLCVFFHWRGALRSRGGAQHQRRSLAYRTCLFFKTVRCAAGYYAVWLTGAEDGSFERSVRRCANRHLDALAISGPAFHYAPSPYITVAATPRACTVLPRCACRCARPLHLALRLPFHHLPAFYLFATRNHSGLPAALRRILSSHNHRLCLPSIASKDGGAVVLGVRHLKRLNSMLLARAAYTGFMAAKGVTNFLTRIAYLHSCWVAADKRALV